MYSISFTDGKGILRKIEISEEIFITFDRFELDDLFEIVEYPSDIFERLNIKK